MSIAQRVRRAIPAIIAAATATGPSARRPAPPLPVPTMAEALT